MSLPRPPQPETPASDAFRIHRSQVADTMTLAYVREGIGGYPLVLVHGYPETKRIYWRNIEPLVAAGYEVIVPDLRGYGDSDLSEHDEYDLVYYSRDLYALVHDVLITAGVFVALGLEFNLQVLAALLVVIGYSLNDTIVIYDRIRENLELRGTTHLQDVVNQSIGALFVIVDGSFWVGI